MNSPLPKNQFSPEDYLAWEATQDTKHEYLDGEVFAMVGVKESHAVVALNLATTLRSHLRGSPCQAYISDMKLHVAEENAYSYPDVFVTCDERDRTPAAEYFKSHPVVVIEVLSESTAAYDRGRKFASYRKLPTLTEYALIDPDALSVEIFRRDPTNHWVLYPYGPGERVEFSSVGLSLPIEEIYEGVTLQSGDTSRAQSS